MKRKLTAHAEPFGGISFHQEILDVTIEGVQITVDRRVGKPGLILTAQHEGQRVREILDLDAVIREWIEGVVADLTSDAEPTEVFFSGKGNNPSYEQVVEVLQVLLERGDLTKKEKRTLFFIESMHDVYRDMYEQDFEK